MARRPFIKNTMGQLTKGVKSLRQTASEKPIYMANSLPTAMVNHCLDFVPILTPKLVFPPSGATCGRFQRFWRACPFWPGQQQPGQTAAFSSLRTRPTVTAWTNALRRAKNVARTPLNPIAVSGISLKPPRTVGSIPMKSPGRCQKPAKIAAVPAAPNMSRSPASAESSHVSLFIRPTSAAETA